MHIMKKLGAFVLAVTLFGCSSVADKVSGSSSITDFYSGKTRDFLLDIEKGIYPESIEYTRDHESKKKYSITDENQIEDISDALVQIVVNEQDNISDYDDEDKLVFVDSKGNEFSFRFRDNDLYYEGDYYELDKDDDLWDLLDEAAGDKTSNNSSNNNLTSKDSDYVNEVSKEVGLSYDMPKEWTSMIEEDGTVTLAIKQNETTFWFPAIQIFEIYNYASADDFFNVTYNYFQEKYPDGFELVEDTTELKGLNYPVSYIAIRYNDGAGFLVRCSYVVEIDGRYFAVESMEDDKATEEVAQITQHVIDSLKLVDASTANGEDVTNV